MKYISGSLVNYLDLLFFTLNTVTLPSELVYESMQSFTICLQILSTTPFYLNHAYYLHLLRRCNLPCPNPSFLSR